MKETELAWAAGFFDGEGCIHITGSFTTIIIGQTDKEPLQRFLEIVHPHNVCTIKKRNTPKDFYVIQASGESAINILHLLYPYLFLKRNKALEAINKRESWANKKAEQLIFTEGNKYEGIKDKSRAVAINNLKLQGHSFEYIGRCFGISRQRVHQIYKVIQLGKRRII